MELSHKRVSQVLGYFTSATLYKGFFENVLGTALLAFLTLLLSADVQSFKGYGTKF